ncbi:MAG: LytR C-terminal domain-containing protein [candidate division WOR-3 bacterium]|uniref:LytR family transcriptional regulator n=1 Tax=candidate division WOR-3 bacterium TaxID=2052148 RepID=A0A7C1SIZ2_UNCW3|nr:LytR C-terminal domain-containing protein [candidate division WOR-3 bacterium]
MANKGNCAPLICLIDQYYPIIIFLIITFLFPVPACRPPSAKAELEVPKVKLEVLNGAGVHRLGRAVERELLARGFDVYRVGDIDSSYEQTMVVDLRDPQGMNAQAIAAALAVRRKLFWFYQPEVKHPLVRVAVDSGSFYEVRLILGRDYRQFFPQAMVLY